VLRLSEREAMAHIKARIVTANVNRAFALYPNECIFVFCFVFLGIRFGFDQFYVVIFLHMELDTCLCVYGVVFVENGMI